MREVENKFEVDESLVMPDLHAVPLDGVHVEAVTREQRDLEATYLDTDDLRLARAGITLRHRTGDRESGWHLKLPTDRAGTREEIRVPEGASPGAEGALQPPDELVDLIRARVRGAALRPVSTLRTTRHAVRLHDRDGAPLVEVVDDRVRVFEGDQEALRFREVEVEDHGGGEAVMLAVGEALREAGAVSAEFTPKLVRALGDRAAEPADPPTPGKVNAAGPAGDAVTAYLRTHVRRLLEEDPRVRLDQPDSVHQMRVACRRLRAGLRTFRPLVDAEWAGSLRSELKWLGSSLGDARDHEVLLDRMRAEIATLPPEQVRGRVVANIEKALGAELEASRARALEALRTDRYTQLVERLVAAATEPQLTEAARAKASQVMPSAVRQAWKRLAKKTGAVVPGESPPEHYHAVRIAAKRARYAAEAVAPAMGKPATRFAGKCEDVQDLLGEHQDAIVAERTLLDLADRRGMGAATFTLGVLHEKQVSRAVGARHEFDQLWPKVDRRRLRRWLDP